MIDDDPGERKCAPLPGVLQNDPAPMVIDNGPFLDFLHGSKAAETDIIVVQAAISYARGSSGVVDITHWRRVMRARRSNLNTQAKRFSGNSSQGQA
jgi:hypothetical protein